MLMHLPATVFRLPPTILRVTFFSTSGRGSEHIIAERLGPACSTIDDNLTLSSCVDCLTHMVGANCITLFSVKIVSSFCFSATSTRLELKEVLNELKEVTKWHELGVQLGVPAHKLNAIDSKYTQDTDRSKTEVIIWWLHNIEDTSWKKLAQAVEEIEHKVLAKKLRETMSPG